MEKTYIEKIQIRKDNKLAALYPTTKMLVVLLYSVCTFIIGTIKITKYDLPLMLIPWYLVVLVICYESGALKKSKNALKVILGLSLFIWVAQAFLVPGGELMWKLGFISIHQKGMATGISLSFMIMDVGGIFVWLFQTTENKEIASALEASGVNHKVSYIFISSLQMIDVLGKNSKTIMNAQKARGIETEGNLIVRAKAFFPALVPLILGAVIGSEERVLTLEARGFAYKGPKTHIFKLEKSGCENKVKAITIIVTILIIGGRIALWIL